MRNMKLIRDLVLMFSILSVLNYASHAETETFDTVFEIQSEPTKEKIEPVTTQQLRLLGGGIQSRQSGQNIALACYDAECKLVRFVYFPNAKEAYYIGDQMRMPQASSPKLQKKGMKLVIQEYFDNHQTDRTDAKLKNHGLVSFLILGGSVTAAVFTFGTTLVVTSGLMAGTFGGYMLLTSRGMIDYMMSGAVIDASMTADTGWNWSSDAKKISDDSFKTILGQIVKGEERHDEQWWINTRRADSIREKLMKKGVQF